MTIGERLRIARENEGLSQDQMGKLCGLAPSMISLYECGKSEPIARNILKLAEVLNITTDELLGRRDITIRVVQCPTCGGTGRVLNE